MRCPKCGFNDSRVIDSRPTEEGRVIRRRRECPECQFRFTTYERLELSPIVVVKKNGDRESFDRGKILKGILKSAEKRPITYEKIDETVSNIVVKVQSLNKKEVSSVEIGELVMDALKDLDEVAYVRFASVYRQFRDVNSFMEELNKMLSKKGESDKKEGGSE